MAVVGVGDIVIVVAVAVVVIVVVVVGVVVVVLHPFIWSCQLHILISASNLRGSMQYSTQPHPDQHWQKLDSQTPSGKTPVSSVLHSLCILQVLLLLVVAVVVEVTSQAGTSQVGEQILSSTFHTLPSPQSLLKAWPSKHSHHL